jgi:hypothetical protein
MTYPQAKQKLKTMPHLKGIYWSMSYTEGVYSSGNEEVDCSVYIAGYGNFEAETWETVMALINKEFAPVFSTEGRPEE